MTTLAAPYQRIGAHLEKWGPFSAGVFASGVTYALGHKFFEIAAARAWEYGAVYSSIFDLTSIFTAFLFAFYSFILTQENGFISRMRKTVSYKLTLRFTLSALYLGGALVLFSIPMMVVEPSPTGEADLSQVAVAAWTGLAVWSMLAFTRAAWLFAAFATRAR